MRWLDNTTDSMDMNMSKLRKTAKDGGAWHAAVHGVERVGHDLATEQQQETWSSLNTDCKQGVSVCVYVQTWLASTKCKVMIATS